jgi:hypothetical protein
MNSNPALKISNYVKFSIKVFEELNFARNNPKLYAKKLLDIKANLKDNILNINGCGIYFTEGGAAFDEAIEFLKSLPNPTKLSLTWSQGIVNSADEVLSLLILHEGIEGMSEIEKSKYELDKRLNHYGAAFGELDELIDYGNFDPEYVVINFIVCDGDPERRERQIVFNPLIKFCGISAGLMISKKICTVINLAEHFYNPGEVVPQVILQKFTNLNLNSSNQYYEQEKEVKNRKRNNSTKLFKEIEEKYKEKNSSNNRGVINLNNSLNMKNESQIKKEVVYNEKSNKKDSSNIIVDKLNANDRENKKENSNEAVNVKTTNNEKENLRDSIANKETIKGKNDSIPIQKIADDEMSLPENVDRINVIEKIVKDKTTGKDVIFVKKEVFYSDGNKDVVIYKK